VRRRRKEEIFANMYQWRDMRADGGGAVAMPRGFMA
jgi:hypothetical protein